MYGIDYRDYEKVSRLPEGVPLMAVAGVWGDTVATVLRETGADLRQIADLLGQKTESMANWYSRDARLSERNRETMTVYDSEIEPRTKIVKPQPKSV